MLLNSGEAERLVEARNRELEFHVRGSEAAMECRLELERELGNVKGQLQVFFSFFESEAERER